MSMYEIEGLLNAARAAARGTENKDSAERFLIKAKNIVLAQFNLSDSEKRELIDKIKDVGYSIGCYI